VSEPVVILKVEHGWLNSPIKGFLHHSGQLAGSDGIAIYSADVVSDAKHFCYGHIPVCIEVRRPSRGLPFVGRITRAFAHVD
jgi:hypothetical protein